MVHGPCGAYNPKCPCMKNESCSKKYPKKFNDYTSVDDRGYPIYRRRSNAPSTTIKDHTVDSSWIVPYNSRMLLRYQCHLNVEVCNQKKAVKYLFKYISKGSDHATAIIESNEEYRYDEIKRYLDSRYIAASEACWRIFEFRIHRRFPPVERLQYHLVGEHVIFFQQNITTDQILDSNQSSKTMLTEWFVANKTYPQAKDLTYVEFPTLFVWNKKCKKWTPRKRGFSIGRLPYASPAVGERYFLRLLLGKVKGATSFAALRTINGFPIDTYKASCVALGLLDDDNEWHLALVEASVWATASQLRYMFVTILLFCEVVEPRKIWESHWESMSDDYQRWFEKNHSNFNLTFTDCELQNKALIDIEAILNENNRTLKDFAGMPFPVEDSSAEIYNRLIIEELNYNSDELSAESNMLERDLTEEQRLIYCSVLTSTLNNRGELFFVHGGGGTGKTYLWKSIITKLRSTKNIVIVVASSGIASLLLPGGRTAHSKFKIPINIDEFSTCNITRQSNLAKLIHEASLIIWDEAPMSSRYIFDAVDRSFRDIMQTISPGAEFKPFGGKTVALGGDFRQILPVIPKGNRHDIVASSLHKSKLWSHCILFVLHKNMRLQSKSPAQCSGMNIEEFGKWLLNIGDGNFQTCKLYKPDEESWIEIPDYMLIDPAAGIHGLVNIIYGDICPNYSRHEYIRDRAILDCRNEEADEINEYVLNIQNDQTKCYLSADSKVSLTDESNDDYLSYPVEFLNSLTVSGIPNHKLSLKLNAPIMLLRNINPSIGLCNGTRLIVSKLGDRVIEAEIITGSHIGKRVAIPRIIMTSEKADLPFILRRRQFPVRLSYAMTINKSQGQSLSHIGLYLRTPVFTHGQLYVALSRARSPDCLKILIEPQTDVPYNYTKNIVYKEVLQSIFEKAQNQ